MRVGGSASSAFILFSFGFAVVLSDLFVMFLALLLCFLLFVVIFFVFVAFSNLLFSFSFILFLAFYIYEFVIRRFVTGLVVFLILL